ncbi:hypothetical protein [Paenibacillus taiwanensis]|uniref:hypothetical protein n=1 Tax=Paenibacillus taiwanensis TaxID=401638 RepID=UPI00048D7D10|nr:hypothetical protein [Paenibacillus taiwanensis]
MDNIIIRPGHSIGTIELGMTKEEVNVCIQAYSAKYDDSINRIFEGLFKTEYAEDGTLISCEIHNGATQVKFLWDKYDVFATKAPELIEKIDSTSKYLRDCDSATGYSYVFADIGIAFWRPSVFNENDIHEDWFKELLPSIQEDEKKYLYFESVLICGPNYYDFLKGASE